MSSLIAVGLHAILILYLLSAILYLIGTYTGKNRLLPWASRTCALGCLANLAVIVIRIIISGRLPLSSGPEFILDFAFLTVFLYLIWEKKSKNVMPGWAVTLISTVLILFVSINAEGQLGQVGHLMPALKSPWLAVHVLTAIIAYAGFALAAAIAVVDIVQKTEKMQDNLIYRIVGTSFVMLSLSIVLGAIWAEQAWGSYWS